MQPFIDSRIRTVFERQIARALMRPNLFDPELLPIKRLFLFYGQPGSGLEDAMQSLLDEYDLKHDVISVSRNPQPIRTGLDLAQDNAAPKVPILWIRQGHVLQYHRELYLQTLELDATVKRNLFVIVTGEEIPDMEHPFYEQFDAIVPTGLPNQEYCQKMLKYYFSKWKAFWKHSQTSLTDEQIEELAMYCDFCTPRDIERFVQKIFQSVQQAYPEDKVDITSEYVLDRNNRFVFDSGHGILRITDRDAQAIQLKFDPEGATTAKSAEESWEREKKRQKN